VDEFRKLAKACGHKLSHAQAKAIMDELDDDCSGEISIVEYEAWLIAQAKASGKLKEEPKATTAAAKRNAARRKKREEAERKKKEAAEAAPTVTGEEWTAMLLSRGVHYDEKAHEGQKHKRKTNWLHAMDKPKLSQKQLSKQKKRRERELRRLKRKQKRERKLEIKQRIGRLKKMGATIGVSLPSHAKKAAAQRRASSFHVKKNTGTDLRQFKNQMSQVNQTEEASKKTTPNAVKAKATSPTDAKNPARGRASTLKKASTSPSPSPSPPRGRMRSSSVVSGTMGGNSLADFAAFSKGLDKKKDGNKKDGAKAAREKKAKEQEAAKKKKAAELQARANQRQSISGSEMAMSSERHRGSFKIVEAAENDSDEDDGGW